MKSSDATELYRRRDKLRKAKARRPVAEKLAIVSRLRDVQKNLAPVRAANKAKRVAGLIKIRVKTA
jgi:hypothetical protein